MTNLEAFIKGLEWNGGSIQQVDSVFKTQLVKSGFESIDDLKSIDDWVDLIAACRSDMRSDLLDANHYYSIRKAYFLKFM